MLPSPKKLLAKSLPGGALASFDLDTPPFPMA
jgi:hypothetical protein